MKKDPIIIYWAPNTIYWNMLYPDPDTVLNDLYKRKSKNIGQNSFFACPAFTDKLKRTYFFKSPMSASYQWDFSDLNNTSFFPISEPYIGFELIRPPGIDKSAQISLSLYYMFFCEESVIASFSAPYFHKPKYMQYGACAPGSFDISQWFRPYPVEITLWEEKGILKIENQEPLFYLEFLTDRPVILKRFNPTQKIIEYSSACSKAATELGRHIPLISRYKTFKDSQMHKLVMSEIKNNILE